MCWSSNFLGNFCWIKGTIKWLLEKGYIKLLTLSFLVCLVGVRCCFISFSSQCWKGILSIKEHCIFRIIFLSFLLHLYLFLNCDIWFKEDIQHSGIISDSSTIGFSVEGLPWRPHCRGQCYCSCLHFYHVLPLLWHLDEYPFFSSSFLFYSFFLLILISF